MFGSKIAKVLSFFILAIFLISQDITAASSADKVKLNKRKNPAALIVRDYALPDENDYIRNSDHPYRSLTDQFVTPIGFGEKIGDTYYETQNHLGSPRQIEWGSSNNCPWTLHFSWMYLPTPALVDRRIRYNGYDGSTGGLLGPSDLQGVSEYAGYTAIDVTDDNRAVIVCHNDQGSGYQIQTYWQDVCNSLQFNESIRVPDSQSLIGNTFSTADSLERAVIWPVVAVQNPADGEPVLHLIGIVIGNGPEGSSLHYFQGTGEGSSVIWTYGNAIDTIRTVEAYDLTASEDGTVAIVWANLLPDNSCPGDTCSQNSSTGEAGRDRWDNDLYVQINRNYGRGYLGDLYDGTTNWWENRLNITKYSGNGFRAYGDMSAMIDPSGDFHVIWTAMKWNDADYGTRQSSIFHWGENLTVGNIRSVATALWDPVNCNSGFNNLNQNKVSLSWCDNKFYAFWVEGNSPHTTGNFNQDDCANRAFSGQINGAANGDLFMAVSRDGGFVFDHPRAITDSYGGPTDAPNGACDPATAAGPCPAEHWVSTATFGASYPVNLPAVSNVVEIDPGYAGDSYIDLSYVDDPEAGGAIIGYGGWYNADIKWLRIPCVEPVAPPCLAVGRSNYYPGIGPSYFRFPEYVKNCEEHLVTIVVINKCNFPVTYTLEIIEDPGTYSGWIDTANFPLYFGPWGWDKPGHLLLNKDGLICSPGTVVKETGRLRFVSSYDQTIDFEIEMYVADTVIPISWDTVATTCITLAIGNNGNAGGSGYGGVNMDYSNYGDWKESADTYLYDGSLIAGWVDGTDTAMYFGMFGAGTGIATSNSLRPLGETSYLDAGWANVTSTGDYATADTTLIFRTNWYAHKHADSCNFLIKETIVIAPNGATNVVIGEAVDLMFPLIHQMTTIAPVLTQLLPDINTFINKGLRFPDGMMKSRPGKLTKDSQP